MVKKQYNIVDLFAGCGGMSQGFRHKGFKVPLANEFWKPAQQSYEASHKDTMLIKTDIREWTNEKIDNNLKKLNVKQIDVIAGGPPCQGFSMAGSRNTEDPRNMLYKEFKRIVYHLQPKFFVFENVKGLLTMKNPDGKKVIDEIVKEFGEHHYKVHYKLLNSADFGVPQERERVILIGTTYENLDKKEFHPKPTHCPKENLSKLKKFFNRNQEYFDISLEDLNKFKKTTDLKQMPHSVKEVVKSLKNYKKVKNCIHDLIAVEDIDNEFDHQPMNHTDIVVRRMGMIEEGKNIPQDQSDWPEELKRKKFASVYKRLHRNEPSCTMVPGHSAFPIHYELNRSLTVREAARLQTLPDTFKFFGSRTDRCLVVGNAVPTTMAEAIAENIKRHIDERNN